MQKIAYFGAGCFWGVESYFRKISGVADVAVGYMGGTTENPTYKDVCTGTTHHAEVVAVAYAPDIVGYESLCKAFFDCHDPTQHNGQGVDIGTQYRSVIFYDTDGERDTAHAVMAQVATRFNRPIATEISPAPQFWRAEEYHQNYFAKNGGGCGV